MAGPNERDVRCWLYYGPDESASREMAARIVAAQGAGVEVVTLQPSQVRSDPGILATEAASSSLFGDARVIRVDGAGDECTTGVQTLLEAAVAGNPVVLIAGTLRKDAKLVKLVDGSPLGHAKANYEPSIRDLVSVAVARARERGLRLDSTLATRLAEGSGGNRDVLGQEVEKLALYADASPEAPKVATREMVDAITADSGEWNPSRLVDAVFTGDAGRLAREIELAAIEGAMGVPIVRTVMRRTLAMAAARVEFDRGANPKAAVATANKGVFWREQEAIARDLRRWEAADLAALASRLTTCEMILKSGRTPGEFIVHQMLDDIVRRQTPRRRDGRDENSGSR